MKKTRKRKIKKSCKRPTVKCADETIVDVTSGLRNRFFD